MRLLAGLLLCVACAAVGRDDAPTRVAVDPGAAQGAVDAVVARHPELARLTVHAIPAGGDASEILACNLPDKIGQRSDPEDLEALTTGRTIVLREGEHFDVTAPLRGSDGAAFGATGITLVLGAGATEADARRVAGAIRAELEAALRSQR